MLKWISKIIKLFEFEAFLRRVFSQEEKWKKAYFDLLKKHNTLQERTYIFPLELDFEKAHNELENELKEIK